jgi:hypothetical protein
VVLLSDPTVILREIGTKKCFYLKSKVPFITELLQPNFLCLYHMGFEHHVVLHSDPTAILREIRTKNCFDLMSKEPFITKRLRYLLCFYHMSREYHVVLLSVPTSILRGIGTKKSISRVKCPSLLNDFNLTCSACTSWTFNTLRYYSVTPLQS